jgi:hypothetical protein
MSVKATLLADEWPMGIGILGQQFIRLVEKGSKGTHRFSPLEPSRLCHYRLSPNIPKNARTYRTMMTMIITPITPILACSFSRGEPCEKFRTLLIYQSFPLKNPVFTRLSNPAPSINHADISTCNNVGMVPSGLIQMPISLSTVLGPPLRINSPIKAVTTSIMPIT